MNRKEARLRIPLALAVVVLTGAVHGCGSKPTQCLGGYAGGVAGAGGAGGAGVGGMGGKGGAGEAGVGGAGGAANGDCTETGSNGCNCFAIG